ncbi:hypothetical protein [Moritella viscosa]|uniref:Uncharacterized protein n=1 Tax=Moritella viscosa TaxID=80854 RepID=A0A1L0B1I8_9GAMM|nr:hypothetical protein [Moritella viscosa]SGY95153.1 Putative uncharacterized protein [Moritella viscosa]
MLTPYNSYPKGFSKETLIQVTSLLSSGFIGHTKEIQTKPVTNVFRSEIVDLNGLKIDLKSGALLFSECLKVHQHAAMAHADDKPITLECGSKSTILRACSIKSNVTISEVKGFVQKFCNELSNDKEITITKYDFRKKKTLRTDSFSIFSILEHNEKDNTLTFKFSEGFIAYINEEGKALTIVQNDDFRKVKSNKTAGVLFLLTQSISNISKDKFLKQEYLIEVLAIKKNVNQILNNAFENLQNAGMLQYEKLVSAEFYAGKWIKYSHYTFSSIKKAIVNLFTKAKNIGKKITITISSKKMSKKEGMKILKDSMKEVEDGNYEGFQDYKFDKSLRL